MSSCCSSSVASGGLIDTIRRPVRGGSRTPDPIIVLRPDRALASTAHASCAA
jgi:hypothetical protein